MNESEKMGHSKEPWMFGSLMVLPAGCKGYHIRDAASNSRALVFKKDDAERIADCVNYCAGVSNDELSIGTLESLHAELAKNKAAREWISVEDSLPPDKHNVLVRHDGGHEFGHITSIAHRFYGGWFPPYREDVIIKVTHWRELPEPPSELRALISTEEKK